jgi:hypothetical protein
VPNVNTSEPIIASAATTVPLKVSVTPTSVQTGGVLTVSYEGYDSGAVWLCYRTNTNAISESIACGAVGSSTRIAAAVSGHTATGVLVNSTGGHPSGTLASTPIPVDAPSMPRTTSRPGIW